MFIDFERLVVLKERQREFERAMRDRHLWQQAPSGGCRDWFTVLLNTLRSWLV